MVFTIVHPSAYNRDSFAISDSSLASLAKATLVILQHAPTLVTFQRIATKGFLGNKCPSIQFIDYVFFY